MNDLFKDINIPIIKKKHFVEIQGKKVEVSLKEKLDILRHGEKNYKLDDGKPVKLEIRIDRKKWPELENMKSNPFWPEEKFIWKN